jgi:hypothetical protein
MPQIPRPRINTGFTQLQYYVTKPVLRLLPHAVSHFEIEVVRTMTDLKGM